MLPPKWCSVAERPSHRDVRALMMRRPSVCCFRRPDLFSEGLRSILAELRDSYAGKEYAPLLDGVSPPEQSFRGGGW
jgi:hypothetical protein